MAWRELVPGDPGYNPLLRQWRDLPPRPGSDTNPVDGGGSNSNADSTIQFDSYGRPIRPDRTNLFGNDEETSLRPELTLGDPLNRDYMTGLRAEGNRKAGVSSDWRNLMGAQMDQQKLGSQDTLARQQASQLSGAQNNMAMRGGIGGSSRERLGERSMKQGLGAQQGLERFYSGQGSQLDIQDELNRQQGMRTLGDAEMGLAKHTQSTDKYNIGNIMGEHESKRKDDMDAYTEAMRAWAADRTAG